MTLPYRLSLMALFISATYFSLGPWLTLGAIGAAAQARDSRAWGELVDSAAIQHYADRLLQGLDQLQQYKRKQSQSKTSISLPTPDQAALLSQPDGLGQLLCGELLAQAQPRREQCWGLQGSVQWQSPVSARLLFVNPDRHWQSSLLLQRVGLFDWRAVAVELPAEAILDRFADGIGLTATTNFSSDGSV